MKLLKLTRNWRATLSTNLVLSAALGASVFANLALSTKVASQHERIVLVPPMMTKETTVGWNEASKNFFEGWGLYAASMIGSVTPRTAAFVANHLEFIFDEAIYQAVKTQLLSIEKDPSYTRTGSVNVFSPRTVTWEATTNRLFVTGDLTTTAYRASLKTLAKVNVTYQMTMKMQSGAPRIMSFTSYTGPARTLKWEREHPQELAKVQKAAEAKAGQIIPQDTEIQRAIEAGEGSAEQANDLPEDGERHPGPEPKATAPARALTQATSPAAGQPGTHSPARQPAPALTNGEAL